MMNNEYWLISLGFLGQAMFGARTVAQWIIAERQGRIVSPVVSGSSALLVRRYSYCTASFDMMR